ncbi:MAG: sugar transferase [bacterium]|nr:sugar transferase [bacterium]
MLKPQRGQKLFIFIKVVIDAILILVSFYLTFYFRLYFNTYFAVKFSSISMAAKFIPSLYFILILYIVTFNKFGLYNLFKKRSSLDILFLILKSVFYVTFILIAMAFLFKSENYSRSLIFLCSFDVFLVMCLSHFIEKQILAWLKIKKIGLEKVAIVGINKKVQKMVSFFKTDPNLSFNFLGYLASKSFSKKTDLPDLVKNNIIGKVSDCENIINKYSINRLIIWDPTLMREELLYIATICGRMDVHLDMVPDLLSLFSRKVSITEINGFPLIAIHRIELERWDAITKRFFDIIVATLSLIILLPVFLIIAILIKIDSPGSVFYTQKRTGKGGRYFNFYKFRSMFKDADKTISQEMRKEYADGFLFKLQNDLRITKLGKFLRKYSLDELPQLFNIIKGEMSLVGPRPLPSIDIKYLENKEDYSFWASQRTNVSPGITGLWQVSGRSNLTFEEMVELDIYYIEKWSIWLDITILLKTIPIVLSGKGAY